MSAISDKYAQLGGPTGPLGPPVTAEVPAAGGGLKQQFANATIYWHDRTGAFEVHGSIHARWQALGGEGSPFGYPTSDETATQDGVGRFSNFEHASIYWQPATGAFEIHGLIRARWRALGSEMSVLGYPTTNETATLDMLGRFNHFQNGSIYWTPSTGANEIYGRARKRWADLRWERGLLGYPIAPPRRETRNRAAYLASHFQNGRIDVNTETEEVYVEKLATLTSPNYSIPLVAYRVSDDDGSRQCAVTAGGVQQWVAHANLVFAAAGVRFVFDGVLRDLNDTEVNNLTGEDDPAWARARDRLNLLAAQHRSVVVVHRAEVGGGFSSWTYDFVAMSFFDSVNRHALWLLAHELGHHFGLPHTFGPTFTTVRQAEDYVLSGQPADAFDGDSGLVNDTPADPMISELNLMTSVDAISLAGQPFSLARNNVMSYWVHNGIAEMSHSQIDRVRQVVLDRRGRYLNVTIPSPVDCEALVAERAALLQRRAELIAERDAETDPFVRRQLAAAVARATSELGAVTARAQAAGCL